MPRRAPRGLARVVTIHDLTMFTRPQDHQRAKRLLFTRAVRYAATHADALICISQATADALTALVPTTVPVHVVPHGVDRTRFTPADATTASSDAAVLRRLGVTAPYVLHLGTIEPRKRVDVLMRAVEQLGRDDVQLVLAGGAWPGMDQQLPAVRRPPRRLGFVSDVDAVALLRGAAVVAYPSAEEGFGLPIVEALACGAPVVTTAGGATEEAARGGALLVDAAVGRPDLAVTALADGLAAALAGDAPGPDARRLAVAGRTWERSAARHVEIYRSVS